LTWFSSDHSKIHFCTTNALWRSCPTPWGIRFRRALALWAYALQSSIRTIVHQLVCMSMAVMVNP
jgi:hypothetical protein